MLKNLLSFSLVLLFLATQASAQETITLAGQTTTLNGSPITGNTALSVNDELLISSVASKDGQNIDLYMRVTAVGSGMNYNPSSAKLELQPYNSSADDYLGLKLMFREGGTSTHVELTDLKIVIQDIDSESGFDFAEVAGFSNASNVSLGANLETGGFENGGGPAGSVDTYRIRPDLSGSSSDWSDETNASDTDVDYFATANFYAFDSTEFIYGVSGSYGSSSFARGVFLNNLSFSTDKDGDGVADYQDLDDDNDGIPDDAECDFYGTELVVNGNFEDAYANWTSDFNRGKNNYAGTAGGCGAQGWVAISPCASTNGGCSNYYDYNGSTPAGATLITDAYGTGANVLPTTSCTSSAGACLATTLADHTSGTGFSLYIDPNDIAGESYWMQSVTVEAGKTYKFSAWIMVIEEDPNLEFKINGTSLTGGINLDRLTGGSNGTDIWQEVSASWNSGTTSGSVVLELVNLTAGCGGNDIRLDDVSLREELSLCDTDGDGIYNHLDLDSDNDGIADIIEAGGTDSNADGRADVSTDTDGDGLVDSYDNDDTDGPDVAGCQIGRECDLRNSTTSLLDTNADGTNDEDGDLDSDGLASWIDVDADADNCPDALEGASSYIFAEVDSAFRLTATVDVNGLPGGNTQAIGTSQNASSFSQACDVDNDGVSNTDDIDDDNDGIPDVDEGCNSIVNDGVESSNFPIGYWSINYYEGHDAITGSSYGATASVTHHGTSYMGADKSTVTYTSNGSFGDGRWTQHETPTDPILPANYVGTSWTSGGNPYYQIIFRRRVQQAGSLTFGLGANDVLDDALLVNVNGTQQFGYWPGGGGAAPDPRPGSGSGASISLSVGDEVEIIFVNIGWIGGLSFTFVTPNEVDYISRDTDGDGICDCMDLDSDNDGIPDIIEAGTNDSDGNGKVDLATDTDGDGLVDTYDNDDTDGPDVSGCTLGSNCNLSNSTSSILDTHADGSNDEDGDFDGDGLANWIDLDSDFDGILDILEAGGTDSNGDGVGDTSTDADGDGIYDIFDPDATDGPKGSGSNGTALMTVGVDGGDGDSRPEYSDGGGRGDTDGDDVPDFLDVDSDNDGLYDIYEAQASNSIIIPTGSDDDFDGVDNAFDDTDSNWGGGGEAGLVPINTDSGSDSNPDYIDTDSDEDGWSDLREAWDSNTNPDGLPDGSSGSCTTDTDGDGYADCFDSNTSNSAVWTTYLTPPSDDGTGGSTTSAGVDITVANMLDDIFPNNADGSEIDEPDWRDFGSPFPVEWLSFEVVQKEADALIKWSTASEINADYFEIERSLDGNTFQKVGLEEAVGNSQDISSYSFT
ncbi:MAG: hypothetical protein AAF696_21225, partial [Bacteroidota bacterium]